MRVPISLTVLVVTLRPLNFALTTPHRASRRHFALLVKKFVQLAAVTAIFSTALPARCDTLYFRITTNGPSWFNPNNWWYPGGPSGWTPAGKIPASGDDVYLQGSPDCSSGGSITVNSLVAQADSSGGSASYTITGGQLSISHLSLNVQSSLDYLYFNGSSVEIRYDFHVPAIVDADVRFYGGSQLIVDGGAYVLLAQNAVMEMQGSILYDEGQVVLTAGSVLEFDGVGADQLSITPSAVLSGSGTNFVLQGPSTSLLFDNNGTVRADAGLMELALGNVTFTNSLGLGTYATSVSNAELKFFSTAYAVQPGNTNQLIGPGLIWIGAGATTITNNGILRIGDGGMNPGIVQLDGSVYGTGRTEVVGSPGLSSQFIWDSGTITGPQVLDVDAWSVLTLTNTSIKTLSGATINNAGAVTLLSTAANNTLALDNGAVFNNLSNALFTASGLTQITGTGGTNSGVFYNAGTFRKAADTSSLTFISDNTAGTPGPSFNNVGLLDVMAGQVLLLGGSNADQFNVAAGANLKFEGKYTQAPGAFFSGAGWVTVDGTLLLNTGVMIANTTVSGSAIVDGAGAFTALLLLTNTGTFQGSGPLNINSGATAAISSPPFASLSRNVNNAGLALLGSTTAGTNVAWNNQPAGSMELLQSATLNQNYAGPPPVLNNAGTISNAAPFDSATIDWFCTNSGMVFVSSNSSLSFNKGYVQTAGNSMVSSQGNLSFNPGALILGGSLSGLGTVSGNITNSAMIHPGNSPGVLTIDGSLTNEPGAVLAVEIAGTNPGSQYSQLNCSFSSVWLNEITLAVTWNGGFMPSVGESFIICTNGNYSGAFVSLEGVQQAGVALVPRYGPSSVTLLAANDPTLSGAALLGTNFIFGFQTTVGVTNIVQYTTNLSSPNWQVLTQFVGDGAVDLVTNRISGSATGFFRVVLR